MPGSGIQIGLLTQRAFTAQAGEATGQGDVVEYREIRQQVELLEQVTGMVRAKAVSAQGGELTQ